MTADEKRKKIKALLAILDDSNQLMFKRMYSRNIEEHVNNTVDYMKEDQLNWALYQVENTVKQREDFYLRVWK